jgi:hypothetical protein
MSVAVLVRGSRSLAARGMTSFFMKAATARLPSCLTEGKRRAPQGQPKSPHAKTECGAPQGAQ